MDLSQNYEQTGNGCKVFAKLAGVAAFFVVAFLLGTHTLSGSGAMVAVSVKALGALVGGGLGVGWLLVYSLPVGTGVAVYWMARNLGCPPDLHRD